VGSKRRPADEQSWIVLVTVIVLAFALRIPLYALS
jgi:hypothetical protein